MTDGASWDRVKAVFQAALDREPSARAAFLRETCRGNPALRAEVDALLEAHERAGDFAEPPIFGLLEHSAVGPAGAEVAEPCGLHPGDHVGPYEILALAGSGGMGEVYRARDPRLGREVAIKVLPTAVSADPDRLRRFEREARAAAGLNHPNVLAVYDIGSHDGSPYVVSELLEGQTLRDALGDGALRVKKALDYAIQIAKGLAAAHEKGIVHRDLKPENLFLTTDGRVKILDFGLAKLIAPNAISPMAPAESVPGLILGTAAYMAPEQIRGAAVDARADVFGLGCVIYEMLSGEPAFQGRSAVEVMTAILKDEPQELRSKGDPVALGLDSIVRHCLDKDPALRFQSARDVAFAAEAVARAVAMPSSPREPATPRAAETLSPDVSRVVVLPFENLSRSPGDEWLAGAFADSLTLGLGDAQGVIIVNREHVLELKDKRSDPQQLSEILGVRYYVTGSYQRVGDDIKVVARLVDAEAGTIKVQESLTDTFAQLLRIEDDLARRFAEALQPQPSATRIGRTSSLTAYKAVADARDLHLAGRYREAISKLHDAVTEDDQYAEGWALLAKSFARLSSPASLDTVAGSELHRQTLRAANRAAELAPMLYEAQVALALAYRGLEDADPWRAAAHRAIELNPRLAEGYVLLGQSYFATPAWGFARRRDPELAERYYRKGLELDPRFHLAHTGLIQHLSWAGREADALNAVDEALRLLPDHMDLLRARAMALLWLKRTDETEQQLLTLASRSASTIQDEWEFAAIALMRGDVKTAATRFGTVIARDPRAVREIDTARVYCSVDRISEAASHLQRAFEADAACAAFVAASPAFAPYRQAPDLRALSSRYGGAAPGP